MTAYRNTAPDLKVSCEACSLSSLCISNGLTQEELADFEQVVESLPVLRKNDYLYRAGDPMKAVFAVKSGAFKGSITDAEGNLHIIGFFLPGELLGFDGIAENRFQCSMVALDDSRVCELPVDGLDQMCSKFPALHREICTITSKNLNSLQQLLLLVSKRPVEERLAVFLLGIIDRYRQRGIETNRFHLPMSRHDIASYLGMAPETLSRQFKNFQSNGWVDVHNNDCTIKNLKSLRKMAHQCKS